MRFCGITLCEMMNNLKSKREMIVASLCDKVNKHKHLSSLSFCLLCSYILSHCARGYHQAYLRSTSLETSTFVRMHASKRVILFNPLLNISFFLCIIVPLVGCTLLYFCISTSTHTHTYTHLPHQVRLAGHPNVKVGLRVQKPSLCFETSLQINPDRSR